jgi:hypothetical protein
MNKNRQEIDCTIRCNVDRAKLLIVRCKESRFSDHVNIKLDIDGHVINKRKGLAKLRRKLDDVDSLEFTIGEVLQSECGLTRQHLGCLLTELADGALAHEGITLVIELIPLDTDYNDYDMYRDMIAPYRVICLGKEGWVTVGRYRSYECAHTELVSCARENARWAIQSQVRIESYWHEDGSERAHGILAVAMTNKNGIWIAESAEGEASIDDMTTWVRVNG